MHQTFIVKTYVEAKSIQDAIKIAKHTEPLEVYLDTTDTLPILRNKPGFNIEHD